jgi:hypothetical protein
MQLVCTDWTILFALRNVPPTAHGRPLGDLSLGRLFRLLAAAPTNGGDNKIILPLEFCYAVPQYRSPSNLTK